MKRGRLVLLAAVLALAGCASRPSHAANTHGPADNSQTRTLPQLPVSTGRPTPPPATSADAVFQDPGLVAHLLVTAKNQVETINTYDYRHIADLRRAASAATTGDLHTKILNTINKVVAPNATRLRITQSARVTDVGFSAIDEQAHDATLMVVGTLTVLDKSNPQGKTNSFFAIAGIRLAKDRLWKLDRLTTGGSTSCNPPGTAALQAACAAAGTGIVAITSYSRANFATEFARAMSLTTGNLRVQIAGQRHEAHAKLLRGHYDTTSEVVASAVEYTFRTQVIVLVAINSFRSGSTDGVPSTVRVTVVLQHGHWLLSGVTATGTP